MFVTDHFTSCRRGSSLIFVLIVTVILSVAGASLMRWAITEKNLHYRSLTRTHAQYGVESTLEHAHAQIITAMTNMESLPRHFLKPDRANLQEPSFLEDFFRTMGIASEEVDLLGVTSPIQEIGEDLQAALKRTAPLPETEVHWAEWVTIDPNDPANAMDNLRGMRVLIREVDLVGSATARRGNVATRVFGRQTLEIRDAPLFAYGAFFNMDMEYSPGQPATFHGSLHVNGNFYFQSNSGLTFFDRVMVTNQLWHGWNPIRGKPSGGIGLGEVLFYNPTTNTSIPFAFGARPQQNETYNSSLPGWHSYALDTYQGGLLNGEHGVLPSIPIATDDSMEEISSWNLISPPARISDINDPDPHREEALRQFERAKFSRSASLHIKVDPMIESIDANPGIRVGEGEWVNLPFTAQVVNGRDDSPWASSVATPALPPELIRTRRGFDLYDPRENGIDIFYLDAEGNRGDEPDFTNADALPNVLENFNQIYLPRDDSGMYLATIDIGVLRDWLEAENPAWWNGVIYIENENYSDPTNPHFIDPANFRPDRTAAEKSGIRIINGETVPRRYSVVQPDGSVEKGWGFTFITNSPVYVQGNFNADGDPATPALGDPARDPDLPEDLDPSADGYIPQEVPAAIVGDAITILSTAWEDHLPYTDRYYRNLPNNQGDAQRITFVRDAGFTEISAGLISGIVPTSVTHYSGGLENFPRLLENWGPFRHDGDAPPPGPVGESGAGDGESSADEIALGQIQQFIEILETMPTHSGWWSLPEADKQAWRNEWNAWLLEVYAFTQNPLFDIEHFSGSGSGGVNVGAWVTLGNPALEFDFGRFYQSGEFGLAVPTSKDTTTGMLGFGTGRRENGGFHFEGWFRWDPDDPVGSSEIDKWPHSIFGHRQTDGDNHWNDYTTNFWWPPAQGPLIAARDTEIGGDLRLPQKNISETTRWTDADRTLRIRGSLVGLYESRFATGPWIGAIHYFPPEREWGFHRFFAEGQYPPGSLMARSYRVRNYEELRQEDYVALRTVILEYYETIDDEG